jgi:hypothetical protein
MEKKNFNDSLENNTDNIGDFSPKGNVEEPLVRVDLQETVISKEGTEGSVDRICEKKDVEGVVEKGMSEVNNLSHPNCDKLLIPEGLVDFFFCCKKKKTKNKWRIEV